MLEVRRASERGRSRHDWLESFHTFSFAGYRDPAHMGFRDLRVINEDFVQPGQGFATHSHRDMEIVTWVLDGVLEHADSLGNGSLIRPGEAQRMSAGTGVTHSEFNASRDEVVHFLQIWILPEREGLEPSYEQTAFPESERRNALRPIASRDGRQGSVRVHQDAVIHAGLLEPGRGIVQPLAPGRHAWLQVARGAVQVQGLALEAGDGAAVAGEQRVGIRAATPSEILFFDLR